MQAVKSLHHYRTASTESPCSAQVTANLSEAKYACNISDEVAEKIARNVKVSLRDYLLYV